MARVKLAFPDENPLYIARLSLRVSDMNYGNHLGNDRVLAILQDARMQWLQSLGLSELDVGGCGLIMADAALRFKNEGFYGDKVAICLFAGEPDRFGFELYYRVEAERNGEIIPLAEAKTGMVCFDYSQRKVAALPETFRSMLSGKA